MNPKSARLPLMLALLAVAGCSGGLIETKKVDYKSATTRPTPLEVPPDLTQPGRDPRYSVPDAATRGTTTYSSYNAERTGTPAATSEVLPQIQGMRIERAGSQRWLVVDRAPEQLWEPLKGFWQDSGFLLSQIDRQLGILKDAKSSKAQKSQALRFAVHLIGDAQSPRWISEAVFDGPRLAREIDLPDPTFPAPVLRDLPV